jgi:hypothetical protein
MREGVEVSKVAKEELDSLEMRYKQLGRRKVYRWNLV